MFSTLFLIDEILDHWGCWCFCITYDQKNTNHKSTSKVISVGRNAERSEAFTLGIGDKDKRFSYHQIHMTFENDRLIELIDHTKPNYILLILLLLLMPHLGGNHLDTTTQTLLL